ncbi:hypothetical protein ACFC63_17510 [Streptomyces albidoflavus]
MSEEAHACLAAEVLHLTFRLDHLYRQQHQGDRTEPTRQRVARLEALLAALQGHPEALGAAAEYSRCRPAPPCPSCGAVRAP